ncbi:glycosyltransferase [Kocuria soli]|uniref:glycosyltransferase n=1 Tax=Kocuria soli TaxID=2485125 RepID=UPI001F40F9EA|nr:glycosyltransferase [Kocuria soli]
MTAIPEQPFADPVTLWAVPVGELGGVGRHVLDVARTGLDGLRLVVLCPPGPLARELEAVGAAVVVSPDFGPAAGVRASVRALRRNARRVGAAVVHTHLAYADVVAACAFATDRSVQLISTEHGIAGEDLLYHGTRWRSRLSTHLHSARLRRFDALIAVSESTRRTMLDKWNVPLPVTVIPNAVNARPVRTRAEEGGPRILSLSRLAPEKRIDLLLRAMPLILERAPGARLTVAGTGPDLESLRELAADLGIVAAVRWPGFVDAWEAMGRHDVVVQLSAWENLSYTLLDARAAGLRVVATDVGGNSEILPPANLLTGPTPQRVADAVLTAPAVTAPEDRPGSVADMVRAISAVTTEVIP